MEMVSTNTASHVVAKLISTAGTVTLISSNEYQLWVKPRNGNEVVEHFDLQDGLTAAFRYEARCRELLRKART